MIYLSMVYAGTHLHCLSGSFINGLPQGDPSYSVRTIFMVRLKWLVLKITIVRHCTLLGFKLQIIIYGSR